MKELSIEEKAKRYDEALKVLHKYDGANIMFTQDFKEEMFPELKESKDEKIRKHLISLFENFVILGVANECETSEIKVDDILAWLEKQGNLMKALQISNARIGELIEKNYYLKEQLEKQGEQKLIVPKFKVGDVITDGKEFPRCTIEEIDEQVYYCDYTNIDIIDADANWKLVEQEPVELGDSEKIRKELLIYLQHELHVDKTIKCDKYNRFVSYLEKQGEHAKFRDSIQVGDKVTRNEDGVLVNLSQLKRVAKPAEVKGEKKPVEPQQDMLSQEKYAKAVDECIYGEKKPAEWSEEDEKEVAVLEAYIRSKDWSDRHIDRALGIVDELVKKLKSLKNRYTWKPSEEQKNALYHIVRDFGKDKSEDEMFLESLLSDLDRL